MFEKILTPTKTYDTSPTQSIVLEKRTSNESVPSIVPESIISETETVQDILETNEDPFENEIISTENVLLENSRVSPVENLLETVASKPMESNGIPINTPTYEDIFHSSEESSSSSSEDETAAIPEVELPDEDQKSIKEDNLKTSEEKNVFEKKLESLFKSNSLKPKIQKNNSESIIRQNEHLNKRRATRPKVRRPIRKRQNRNGRLLMVL